MSEPKIRARNFPMWLLKPLFKVASFGEKKHGSLSFLTSPITVNDHLDALKRHLIALEDPNVPDLDDESKELHSSHIAWRALAVTHLLSNKKELDDRYHLPSVSENKIESLVKTESNYMSVDRKEAFKQNWNLIQKIVPSPRFPVNPDGTCDYIVGDVPSISGDCVSSGDTGPGNWDLHQVQDGYVQEDEKTNLTLCKCGNSVKK